MHETPDATIVALARRHHGLVTTTQLLSAGFGHNAITLRVAKGWLRRLHRGVYLVGALESDLTKPAAALLATGPHAAISHRTAATIWELLPPDRAIRSTSPSSMPIADPATASRSITPEPSRRAGIRASPSPPQTRRWSSSQAPTTNTRTTRR
jgi:hypothetical protein